MRTLFFEPINAHFQNCSFPTATQPISSNPADLHLARFRTELNNLVSVFVNGKSYFGMILDSACIKPNHTRYLSRAARNRCAIPLMTSLWLYPIAPMTHLAIKYSVSSKFAGTLWEHLMSFHCKSIYNPDILPFPCTEHLIAAGFQASVVQHGASREERWTVKVKVDCVCPQRSCSSRSGYPLWLVVDPIPTRA